LGVSILSALGLESAIASDEDDYVARALQWSSDLQSLVSLRASLRERMLVSPLCDAARVAHAIDAAALDAFARWASPG
jgi:protein O-GlcNAc transferase